MGGFNGLSALYDFGTSIHIEIGIPGTNKLRNSCGTRNIPIFEVTVEVI